MVYWPKTVAKTKQKQKKETRQLTGNKKQDNLAKVDDGPIKEI